MKNVIDKVIIFVPPDSCGRGGPHAPPPAALVDTVDTALIDPSSGNSRLTVNALRRAVGDGTTHRFLTAFPTPLSWDKSGRRPKDLSGRKPSSKKPSSRKPSRSDRLLPVPAHSTLYYTH
eukprot:scaffold43818_cov52-Phaeocystis_antarctica.AAC.1